MSWDQSGYDAGGFVDGLGGGRAPDELLESDDGEDEVAAVVAVAAASPAEPTDLDLRVMSARAITPGCEHWNPRVWPDKHSKP